MAHRALTDKQQRLIELLVDGVDPQKAKVEAGYSEKTSLMEVVKPISQEILEACRDRLVVSVPQAVLTLISGLGGKLPPSKEKLAYAESVLDRTGLGKTETINMKTDGQQGIFFLPAKQLMKEDPMEDENEAASE